MMISWNEVSAESKLETLENNVGSLYFCTDTGNLFLDSQTNGRIAIAKDVIYLASEFERESLLVPIPSKIYCIKDSNKLYYYDGEWHNVGGVDIATATKAGLLSSEDKVKLDGIEEGANKIIVDAALSSTSENPVQNKVVKEAIDDCKVVAVDENRDGNVEIRSYVQGETIPGTSVEIDKTLSVEGMAADAKAVGDAIANIDIPESVVVDSTLSVPGAAADAKTTGDAIKNIKIPTVPSIDTTLTVEGAAADAKAVGDRFDTFTLTENNYGSELPESGEEGQLFLVEDTETTDTTLSIKGSAADAKAVGDALATKAPDGYGLGYVSGKKITDCNLAIENGWYWTTPETKNQPLARGNWMRVDAYNDKWTHQEWYNNSVATKCERYQQNGVWTEWEWVNPPMENGVEYRTTERYARHPVYVKFIYCGTITNNKTVSTGLITGTHRIIRYSANDVTVPFPRFSPTWGNDYDRWATIENPETIAFWCGSSYSGDGYVTIWYFKKDEY